MYAAIPDRAIASEWLSRELQAFDSVKQAHVFGSFFRGAIDPADADLMIVFKGWEARDTCTRIKASFMDMFHTRLHIQMFNESQRDEIATFLEEAAPYWRIR